MPDDTVLDVDVLDFTLDVSCDVTVDVVTDEAVVEVVGVRGIGLCRGMVTPGSKHCTVIGESSVKCTRRGIMTIRLFSKKIKILSDLYTTFC